MLLDRRILLDTFDSDDFPSLPCPCCNSSLRLIPKTLQIYRCAEMKRREDLSDDEGGGAFIGMLLCVNSSCEEAVAVSGYAHPGTAYDGHEPRRTWFLRPHMFTPHILLFRIPDETPREIDEALQKSFGLFWADTSAAGNALRTALEALLDYRGVLRWASSRRGKLRIDLHRRIENSADLPAPIKNFLLAAKWVGNRGSHSSDLDTQSLLAGYELFEAALEELFEGRTARLTAFANALRVNQGALGQQASPFT